MDPAACAKRHTQPMLTEWTHACCATPALATLITAGTSGSPAVATGQRAVVEEVEDEEDEDEEGEL